MMYTYYNPNPNGATVGDCVVRALCKAFCMDWDKCFSELVAYAYWLKDMPSANRVWGKLLSDKGYHRKICDCDCTVAEFAEEHTDGIYILALQNHVVCVIDGVYYDSWDSGLEVPLYYWQKKL